MTRCNCYRKLQKGIHLSVSSSGGSGAFGGVAVVLLVFMALVGAIGSSRAGMLLGTRLVGTFSLGVRLRVLVRVSRLGVGAVTASGGGLRLSLVSLVDAGH